MEGVFIFIVIKSVLRYNFPRQYFKIGRLYEMLCKYCGREAEIDANFCSNCGQPIDDKRFIAARGKISSVWRAPLISAVLAVFWITGFYAYEIKTSFDIDNLCEQAETLGLEGKIDEAVKVIDKGLARRPNNAALNNDKVMLMYGKDIVDHLIEVDNFIRSNNYKLAENEVQLAEGELANLTGSFYSKLDNMIKARKVSAVVLKVKTQMNTNKNIDDLAVLLTEVEQYDTDEAREASSELRRCIGNAAYDRGNECLKVKDFTTALDIVNEGLTYDLSNERLSSFKDTISEQKEVFEKVEKESIEQAMEAAAKEDNFNRTAALNLVESSGEFNSSGDFVVKGKIRNNATKAVSTVKIFYSIYDSNSNRILDNSTYVYPNYIKPGETGEFENTEYGMLQGCGVKIIKMTWYIE
jgi:hypothetical protein